MVWAAIIILIWANPVAAALYYIAPGGDDVTGSGSSASPWKTWSKVNGVIVCGDSAVLKDGTFGDGTTTGKIAVSGRACTLEAPLTITAQNQRQAMVNDSGCGIAVDVLSSSGVIVDGLYARSNDNNAAGCFDAGDGTPIRVKLSNDIILRNNVSHNPNRYANTHAIDILNSQNVTIEDNEIYKYHRHAIDAWHSIGVVSRRNYRNPRGGAISGGFGSANGLNRADAGISFYPVDGGIEENGIVDGTTTPGYLAEMNASYGSSVPARNIQVLGSICYKCNYGNGIFPNSRSIADLNHTPQNITIKDVVFVDWASSSRMIRLMDCVNCTIDHVTGLATGAVNSLDGLFTEDGSAGVSSASNSLTATNILIAGVNGTGGFGTGFRLTGFDTWTLNETISSGNTIAYSPSSDPASAAQTLSNTSTAAHGMGTCKAWVPAGAAGKGAGTGGSDIGATILYRYVNGALTTVPLWDPVAGEFPHGAFTQDGVNNVAGESLFDFHTRININMNGCPFPAGYGESGGGGGAPSTVLRGTTAASGLSTAASPLSWNHTISSNQDGFGVCLGLWDAAANVGSATGVDVSGQAMSLVKRQVTAPDAYRAAEYWWLANPTSGSRTITATLTGNISGALGRSTEFDVTSGLNTAVGASTVGSQTILSVTAPTNVNERVEDCTVSSKFFTYTHGADQTGDTDLDHSSQALRLSTSTQNGSDGGVMSNSSGGANLQAKVAVSLIAGTPDAPSTSTFRITKYRVDALHGSSVTPEVTVGPLGNQDQATEIGIAGAFRVRLEVLVETASSTETGVALYCQKDAVTYARVGNLFGANIFRFYGTDTVPTIPATLTPTTARFSGVTFVPGWTVRDDQASIILPVMAANERTELDFQLVAGNGFGVGDFRDCELRRDDGSTLGVHTVTPRLVGAAGRGAMGF